MRLLPVVAALLLTACAYRDAPALTDAEDLFVRGSFNGWQTVAAHQLQKEGADSYVVVIPLTTDVKPQYFKLGDDNWRLGANCGPREIDADQLIALGQTVAVDCNQPRRSFSLQPPANGPYRFTFTTVDKQLKLKVEQL